MEGQSGLEMAAPAARTPEKDISLRHLAAAWTPQPLHPPPLRPRCTMHRKIDAALLLLFLPFAVFAAPAVRGEAT